MRAPFGAAHTLDGALRDGAGLVPAPVGALRGCAGARRGRVGARRDWASALRGPMAAAILVTVCASFSEGAFGADSPADTVSTRPDFSGVWLPDGRHNAGQWPKEPPFTPAMAAARAEYAKRYLPVNKDIDDENTSCIPYGMLNTMLGIAQYPFEILSTPTQLTLLTEIFGSVRRIYLDGRSPPPELLPSRMGFSTGHWEGAVLVVETTHLRPDDAGGARPGSPAQRIVERLSVVPDPRYGKALVDEITVHDPRVYTRPITVTMRYKWAPDVQVGEYLCQQDVWDQNREGHPTDIPWRK